MSSSPDPTTALVVPVDVVALCVGEQDADRVTGDFAGATAVYTEQVTRAREAFLGANVTRSFNDPPVRKLGRGVHLHWALPDGLTHAATETGTLDFPAAPDRWLVTRLLIDGTSARASRSWLIESDALQDAPPAGQRPVTVPISDVGNGGERDYAFLGRWHVVDAAFSLAALPPVPRLRDVGGTELTAVANGEVHFAAYYPACASVFGFHDDLLDLRLSDGATAQLAYAVSGWYDVAAHDPIRAGLTRAEVEAAYGWTWSGDTAPSSSVYEGGVEGIAWNPRTRYLEGSPIRRPLPAQVALGNNPAESLGAYFGSTDLAGNPLLEELLDGFQLSLLDSFSQPRPNQLTWLSEQLHDARFASTGAPLVHVVLPRDDRAPAVELEPQLADDLGLLNERQEQYDQGVAHVDWLRWQLFADWYRIFVADRGSRRNLSFRKAYRRYGDALALAPRVDGLRALLDAQLLVVRRQLPAEARLDQTPAERWEQPGDPVALLTGRGLELPARHGGDGRWNEQALLVCRTADTLLSAVAIDGRTLTSASLTQVTIPAGVPAATLLTALAREACLLDTRLASALAGAPADALRAALEEALGGHEQRRWSFTGAPPSPVTVNWFDGDPWLPLIANWRVDYLPLSPTDVDDAPAPYGPQLFGANFTLDVDAGGAIAYTPSGGPGSISVDPARAVWRQVYSGSATLSPRAPETLARLLDHYLVAHEDRTLRTIADQLAAAEFVTAPLSGFTNLLQMRRQSLQLNVSVPPDSDYAELTETIAPVIGGQNAVGPEFNGDFNPFRAGWMRLSLQLVDAYGQKRAVAFDQLLVADAMRAFADSRPLQSVAYLPPRVAPRSRLLFRWLGADAARREQVTSPPPTSPVCGWLVPDHLDGSLFLYDADGHALGTLFLSHDPDGPPVGWLSAPGDNRTIGQPIETALALADPQLQAFALALFNGTRDYFTGIWRALDRVAQNVDPTPLASDSGLITLVGRPVALAQAALRMELDGRPPVDLGWDALAPEDSDEGLTQIALPVVLGDFRRLGDGLIGYFKQAGDGYDLATFYTQGARADGAGGVVRPRQDTLALRLFPPLAAPEPPDRAAATARVLLLLDPRGAVHATSGILPTAALALAPDQVNGALSTLDLAFFAAPVLRGEDGLTLPVPQEAGFQNSWVEQVRVGAGNGRAWAVTPEIAPPAGRAIWSYTPQTVTEGWLRLNPILLAFELLDAEGKPVVTAGVANAMTLRIANRSRRPIAFDPGAPVPEGNTPNGSIFYLHLGGLVAPAHVADLRLSAAGWQFARFDDPRGGPYWAAATTTRLTLGADTTTDIAVADLIVPEGLVSGRALFDYYAVDGLNDGVYADALAVQPGPGARARR